jgi:hypothetical protein
MKGSMKGELDNSASEPGQICDEKRPVLHDHVALLGKPHDPIRLALFIALLVVAAGLFGGAWLNVWKGVQSIFLPMFLVCLSVLIGHGAYANRLLPPPNKLAQIAGYLQAVWCLALAAILLWKYIWP